MSSFARRMIGFEGMPRRDERSVDWEWIQRHGCLLARVHSVYVCVCVRWGGGEFTLGTNKKERARQAQAQARLALFPSHVGNRGLDCSVPLPMHNTHVTAPPQ